MMDLKGPSIRTGLLKDKKPIELKSGDLLRISTDNSISGTKNLISCDYPYLLESVEIGDPILIADGNLNLKIIGKNVDE